MIDAVGHLLHDSRWGTVYQDPRASGSRCLGMPIAQGMHRIAHFVPLVGVSGQDPQ